MGKIEGKQVVCERCGRVDFCESIRDSEWSVVETQEHKYWLCPSCSALLDRVIETIIQGKSVSVPAIEDYQY